MSWAKTEKHLWSRLKNHLPLESEECTAVRIESWAGKGVPDVILCWLGCTSWLELKVATPTGIVHIAPEQVIWGRRWIRAGGRHYYLVDWKGEMRLYDGMQGQALIKSGCGDVLPLAIGFIAMRSYLKGEIDHEM